jgi:hypothetical protein
MALIEVKFFNSFVLRKTVDEEPLSAGPGVPIWQGSRGIPQVVGGYAQGTAFNSEYNWVIEESRIRGGYNNTSVSLGAKAYLVEEEPQGAIRGNAMIYSGIFNSRTGINNTNQFPVGSDITKGVDPANGSIQKLYAEDTNLIIFQEKKVNKALIDKDAIYTAEGGGVPVSQLRLVIGQIVPYAGNFGIGTNPESFAVYGYRKYFVDKNRNAVLRLSRDGITEISNYGMIDFFRDNLSTIDSAAFGDGYIPGGWDIYTKQYTVSLQDADTGITGTDYNTLQFDETVLGWPSRYSFKPRFMFSLANRFYSIENQDTGNADQLYQHNRSDVSRASFYGVENKSNITFVVNPDVGISKVFKTVNYEGSNGWYIKHFVSDIQGVDSFEISGITGEPIWLLPPQFRDATNIIYSYYEGEYVINPTTGNAVYKFETSPGLGNDYVTVLGTDDPPFNREYAGFNRKENKYYANLVQSNTETEDLITYSTIRPGEVRFGPELTGIKAYYCTVTIENDDNTNPGGMKELFAVNTEFVKSS